MPRLPSIFQVAKRKPRKIWKENRNGKGKKLETKTGKEESQEGNGENLQKKRAVRKLGKEIREGKYG